ncbi:MAG: diguanylate cyclase, partial [Zoogloea sp.]|nr:diguanylate cyclase [Zoogloea sp.]
MSDPTSPFDIAREALLLLARQHIPPTPENYRTLYDEIAHAVPHGEHHPAQAPDVLQLSGQLGRLLEHTIAPLLDDAPTLSSRTVALAAELRRSSRTFDLPACMDKLHSLIIDLEKAAASQASLRAALQHLFQIILDNVRELVQDDRWLQGQLSLVGEAFANPLDTRMVTELGQRLRTVVHQQSQIKSQINEAQDRLKAMLSSFVDHLGDFSASTSGYHGRIEQAAQRISSAGNISEISEVLDEVLHETLHIQTSAQRSQSELQELRQQVDHAQREIDRLHTELEQTSELVRLDALTGALNRKGLDEAMEREIARARRQGSSLCLALLDVDNFKRINDRHGHHAGDDALRHLARVIRDTLRPQDIVARYGGEEFVVLLPDTEQPEAVA